MLIRLSGLILLGYFMAIGLSAAMVADTDLSDTVPTSVEVSQDDQSDVGLRQGNASLIWERAQLEGWARSFMQDFPKGGDLHNHLTGAIYAETWIEWAAEDGMCVDLTIPALRDPGSKTCDELDYATAANVQADELERRALIDALSNRSFVPRNGYSGHNDFFDTFGRMARKPYRLGDMLAAVAERAAAQNILYLELMETPILGELFGVFGDLQLTGDVTKDADIIKAAFGDKYTALVASAKTMIDDAFERKDQLLRCGTSDAKPGCGVKIRLLYQVIREFAPEIVFAQFMLGWEVIKDHPYVLGMNLVAPEDGFIALRDYSYHMRMIDHLYQSEGARNVSLHAGELTMGLVRPRQLRFHIREAIELGHAKRIGHGIDIKYEERPFELMQYMADNKIMVEINLTSNATILGVQGADHPFNLYRRFGVPLALSTDDEGVSRIDLTHEYIRAADEQNVRYQDLKAMSRNSLTYSFLPGESLWDIKVCVLAVSAGKASDACREAIATSEKAAIQWKLEEAYRAFEATARMPKAPVRIF